jgi:hypothetical protein
VYPSRRHLRPVKSIPREGLGSGQLYDGSDRPDTDSLQRRRSRGRSSDSASTPSATPVAEPSAAPRHLQLLLIRGGRAPDVHVSLVVGEGHGLTPTIAEAGGLAPKRMGESAATVEAATRSGVAPETAGPNPAATESVGSKRAAPQQGMSDRPVKKARVRSKM